VHDLDLFRQALGLEEPWEVVEVKFDAGRRRLDLRIDFRRGARFPCPECGAAECKVHDSEWHTWRHLNFFQHEAYLHARVPRVRCPEHNVRQVLVPWARERSDFTPLFEALVMALVAEMPVKAPAELEDLDAPLIGAFLAHLEGERGNNVRTRNARLTAIHSFFQFPQLEAPEHAALIQGVLAIPNKRFDTRLISYLTRPEIEALLKSPDRSTWLGRRDHALLLVVVQTGLRVSELAGLRRQDVQLASGAHVRCDGKGRKERCTPLTRPTVAVLRSWLRECGQQEANPLFPTSSVQHLTRSGIWRLVAKHAKRAQQQCPSIAAKHVTPHVYATAARCHYCKPGSTRPSSPCGWGTRTSAPPSPISTPTSPSRNEPSRSSHPPTSNQAATSHRTPCSPSSKRCDYAHNPDERMVKKPAASR
jgi:site-specific recombinase XerD